MDMSIEKLGKVPIVSGPATPAALHLSKRHELILAYPDGEIGYAELAPVMLSLIPGSLKCLRFRGWLYQLLETDDRGSIKVKYPIRGWFCCLTGFGRLSVIH